MEERYSSTNSYVDPILTSRGSLRSTFIPIPKNNESARAMHWTKNSCRSQKQSTGICASKNIIPTFKLCKLVQYRKSECRYLSVS